VPKACSLFFDSDAVFVAKVLSRAYADNDERIRFEVRVSRVLRGETELKADVYTGNDRGRLNWDIGRPYVVVASRREGRLWSGDDCGPLSDPMKVAEMLKASTRQSPRLREVLRGLPVSGGGPGVLVRAKGNGKTYEASPINRASFKYKFHPGGMTSRSMIASCSTTSTG
jgi:hypothetical protein